MSNPFYTRQTQFSAGDLARASDVNAELDAVVTGFDNINLSLNLSIGMPASFAGNLQIPIQTYPNKLVYINGDGNLDLYEFANISAYQAVGDASAASAALAAQWASEAEDVVVSGGEYSAKHYMLKTQTMLAGAASTIGYTPSGDLVATNIQAALDELEAEKAGAADVVGKLDAYNPSMTGTMTEEIWSSPSAGSIGVDPNNGSIQTFPLTGNATLSDGLSDGQTVLLAIDTNSGASIVTWPISVFWKSDTGFAPALNATGYTFVALWKVDNQLYGARVGNA